MQLTSIISMLMLSATSCLAVPLALPASDPVTGPEEGLLAKPRTLKADSGVESGLAMPRALTSAEETEHGLMAKSREIETGLVEVGLVE